MDFFNKKSIKAKLVGTNVLTSIIVLGLCVSLIAAFTITSYKENAENFAQTVADITSKNVTASLVFEDRQATQNILKSYESSSEIEATIVYDEKNRLFASYPEGRFSAPVTYDDQSEFIKDLTDRGFLIMRQDIVHQRKRVGAVLVVMNQSAMNKSLMNLLKVSVFIFLASSLFAFIISSYMQKLVANPIIRLTQIAKSVSQNSQKNIDNEEFPDDEIGDLFNQFKIMLDQLNLKEEALKENNLRLEQMVKERTRNLNAEIKTRVAAQESLAASEQKFRSIIENSNEVFALANEVNSLQYVSPKVNDLFNCSQESLLGKGWSLGDARVSAQLLESFNSLAISNRSNEFQYEFVDSEKKTKYISHIQAGIFELGKLVGCVHCLRDITAKVNAEKEKEILNDQLIQSSKLASVGTLASGVAHELNNPLTAVLGFSQILSKMHLDNERSTELSGKIGSAANRMKKIIDHLRSYSRESKKGDWRIFNIEECIENSLILLEARLKLENAKITVDLVGETFVYGNSTQLESVFQNFIVNSLQAYHSDADSKEIVIKSFVSGSKLIVEHSDNGSGMSKDVLDRIFDPFYTTKEAGRGTGLGLSLISNIIDSHQGDIKVESEVGVGTKFVLSFPLAQSEADNVTNLTLSTEAHKSVEPMAKSSLLDSMSILVIDDETDILEVLGDYFENSNLKLCDNPEEAKIIIENQKFDLIITDLKMPKVSGFDIIEHALSCWPEIVVFVMSGHAETDGEVASAMSLGACGFISKPFAPPHKFLVEIEAMLPKKVA